MRTLLRLCIATVFLTTTDVWAYCIYNDSDTRVSLRGPGNNLGVWIAPGENVCCNYADTSCNASGQRDAMVKVELHFDDLDRKKGYYIEERTGDSFRQCGEYIPATSPLHVERWPLYVHAGGYARFGNHPSFKNTHYVSFANPAFLVRTFDFNDQLVKEYPCPNGKDMTRKLREGTHDERIEFIESDRPADHVKLIGYARKCLTASSRTVHAPLQLFTCDTKDSQRWDVLGDAIRLNGNNLCIASKSLTVGRIKTPPMILLDTCSGAAEQKFYVKDDRIKYNDECLDVQGAVSQDGTGIVLYRCKGVIEGQGNQSWIPTR